MTAKRIRKLSFTYLDHARVKTPFIWWSNSLIPPKRMKKVFSHKILEYMLEHQEVIGGRLKQLRRISVQNDCDSSNIFSIANIAYIRYLVSPLSFMNSTRSHQCYDSGLLARSNNDYKVSMDEDES